MVVGYLAVDEASYTAALVQIYSLTADQRTAVAARARAQAMQFDDTQFVQRFLIASQSLLSLTASTTTTTATATMAPGTTAASRQTTASTRKQS